MRRDPWSRDPAVPRGPVILNVNPDPELLDSDRGEIEAAGGHMIGCVGPDRAAGCPLLDEGPCSRFELAQAIILQLDLDNAAHRRVLSRYVTLANVPLRVIVSREEAERWATFLRHLAVEVSTPTRQVAASLIEEI